MSKVISVISTKGSVGKTTLIIHIAGYLASVGKKVLLIDADSQQTLSKFFSYPIDTDVAISRNGFGKWFSHAADAVDIIHTTANSPNIDIITNDDPAKFLVSKYLRDNTGAVYQLPSLLKTIKDKYDYIFIDTEGADGRDHDGNSVQNAALLAEPDLVLSVTKTKMLYAMEALRVVDVYKKAINAYGYIGKVCNPPLKFIVNEHDRGLSQSASILTDLQEAFADEQFGSAELLSTVVPLKKKFFEEYYHSKVFAHQYTDTSKHDHINEVIKKLCEELFPDLAQEENLPITELAQVSNDADEVL